MSAEVKLTVNVVSEEARGALAKFKKAIQEILVTLKAKNDAIKAVVKSIQEYKYLIGFVVGSIAGFVASLLLVVREAGKQEAAVLKLAVALQKHGGVTEKAVRQQIDYAQALAKVTTYQDDEIIGAQARLASYGLTGEMLKKATKATLDYAAATGTGLDDSAKVFARASQGQTRMLQMMGFQFNENATKSEKFNQALSETSRIMGGAAIVAAQTFEGKMKSMKNSFAEVEEQIGAAFLPMTESTITAITLMANSVEFLINKTRKFLYAFGAASMRGSQTGFLKALDEFDKLEEKRAVSKAKKNKSFLDNEMQQKEMAEKEMSSRIIKQYEFRLAKERSIREVTLEEEFKMYQELVKNKQLTEDDKYQIELKMFGLKKQLREKEIFEFTKLRDFFAKDLANEMVNGNKSITDSFDRLIKKIEQELIEKALVDLFNLLQKISGLNLGINFGGGGGDGATSGKSGGVGKTIGTGIGTAIGGPIGGLVGGFLGGLLGQQGGIVPPQGSVRSRPLPKFASGGVIEGSSMGGDMIPVRTNAGEMIINRTQQARLLGMIDSAGGSSGPANVTLNISGGVFTGDKAQVRQLAKLIDEAMVDLGRQRQLVSS